MKRNEEYFWVALGALGDALMLLSLADTVLANVPDARAHLLATRNAEMIANLASDNPRIAVHRFSLLPVFRAWVAGKRVRICFPPTFGFVPFHIKLAAALLVMLPKVTVAGFRDRGQWHPYHKVVPFEPSLDVVPNLIALARACGMPVEDVDPHPVFTPLTTELSAPYICIHPFAANLKRSLPPSRWQALIAWLRKTYPSHYVVITGNGPEEALAREWFREEEGIRFALNRPIREVAGILSKAELYIGVDTGVTHLAGVLKVPSIVLENNSNPMWFPSYNPRATILVDDARCTCTGDKGGDCTVMVGGQPYFRCLYDISDEEIHSAVRAALS